MSEYISKIKKIHDYLGGKCVSCGSTENLQIDHIDHTSKLFSIANHWGRSWEFLKPEIAKCQLLCKDCHLIKSKEEGSLAKGWTNQPKYKHGTVRMYSHYKCRCDECKLAKSLARKRERRK